MPDSPSEIPALQALVGHREFVRAGETLEAVQQRFAAGRQDFMAVIDGPRLLGLCSRGEIGTLLGARYGFALYGRAVVAQHLAPHAIQVTVDEPLPALLQAIAARRDEHFYDDVLLVDRTGGFLGLIFVRELVRLQNTLLGDNIAELGRRNREMEEDLRMAREVQVALLPREFPDCRGAGGRMLRFAQVFQPAGGVSGDFFDVLTLPGSAAGLLMCDVMGHGVRSALVTAMVRTAVEELQPDADEPGVFLTRLNLNLTRLLRRAGNLIFVTATYVVVDPGAGRLRLAHAGHPAPLHYRAREGVTAPVAETRRIGGPALGLLDEHEYEVAEITLQPGDRIVLLTDGIEEAADAAGKEFGTEGLCRELTAAAGEPLAGALDRLVRAAQAHAGTGGFGDDVCLLACELATGQY